AATEHMLAVGAQFEPQEVLRYWRSLTSIPPVQSALEAAAVAGHAEAADEEDDRREDVALLGEAQPGGILERLIHRTEQVDEADDGDQRGILEQVDDVVDDARHNDTQSLRQCHEQLHLPPSQAKRIGGLLLLDRNALQTAAYGLGHIGGVEEGECHHG